MRDFFKLLNNKFVITGFPVCTSYQDILYNVQMHIDTQTKQVTVEFCQLININDRVVIVCRKIMVIDFYTF
jgi:hypothetical protein